MATESKINIDLFKAVTKSIAHSEDLDMMSNHLTQLLTSALDIKGCAIFVVNSITEEMEILASFGLSAKYLTKGLLSMPKSVKDTFRGSPVIIPDVSKHKGLQYPEEAEKEGISAIVSIPVVFTKEVIGVLRLYHYKEWDLSDQDMDSLMALADNIGLAMTFIRYHNAVHFIAEVIGNTLSVEMTPKFEK
ncbi:MAG: GAF domain-containing protein [Desulfobacteraceae bacterium]|nr:GAF domain-containing protein [Desulfobacteraceae bacterium]